MSPEYAILAMSATLICASVMSAAGYLEWSNVTHSPLPQLAIGWIPLPLSILMSLFMTGPQ